MTTKLIKRTIEEALDEENVIIEKVVAMEIALLDENGNEIGRVNTNLWGGNFNINAEIDVEIINEAIANIFIKEEKDDK